MNIELWKTLDRWALQAEVRAVCDPPRGVVLAVRGDEDCALMTVADFVCAFMEDLGLTAVRIRPVASKPTLVNDLLGRAWRQVDAPAALGAVPRSVSEARHMTSADLIVEIAACCATGVGQTAFVFDVVDPDERVSRVQMGQFADLARSTGAPVIIFCRAESASALPRTIKLIDLVNMELGEVEMTLRTSVDFAAYDAAEIDELYSRIVEMSADATTVRAVDAYDAVEERLWEMDEA